MIYILGPTTRHLTDMASPDTPIDIMMIDEKPILHEISNDAFEDMIDAMYQSIDTGFSDVIDEGGEEVSCADIEQWIIGECPSDCGVEATMVGEAQMSIEIHGLGVSANIVIDVSEEGEGVGE